MSRRLPISLVILLLLSGGGSVRAAGPQVNRLVFNPHMARGADLRRSDRYDVYFGFEHPASEPDVIAVARGRQWIG